jgi:DNA-binding MarR family transcriptional regulator
VLRGRPLYDNKADAALFSTPPEWDVVERALRRDLNSLIIGGRGIGKTTFLRQLQFKLRASKTRVIFVDANALSDPLELAERVHVALTDARSTPSALRRPASEPASTGGVARASRALAEHLTAIGDFAKTTILIDGSSAGDALYGIFGRMRDSVWRTPHTWAVAIDSNDRATLQKPPADAFFDNVAVLEPWSSENLVALLWRRLGGEDASQSLVRNAAAAAGGNPREALRAVQDAILHDRDPAELSGRRSKLLDEASELGRSHGMLMAELLDRGQASPSDDDLQAALGLTRSRLTHLLRQLLEKSLVVAETDRQAGPGRPRTVYRPALPAA